MKTKKCFVLGALGASMLVSCNKEEIIPDGNNQENETTDEEAKIYSIDELESLGFETYTTPDEVRQFEMEHNGGMNNSNRENVVLKRGDASAKLWDFQEDALTATYRRIYFRRAMREGTCQLFASPNYVPNYPFSEGDHAHFYEKSLPSGFNAVSNDDKYLYQAIETNVWYDLEDHLTRSEFTYKLKENVPNLNAFTILNWDDFSAKTMKPKFQKEDKLPVFDWYLMGSPGPTYPDPLVPDYGGAFDFSPPPPATDIYHAWFEDFEIKSMKNKVSAITLEMNPGMALVIRDTDTGNITYFSWPEYIDGELNNVRANVTINLTGETWNNTIDQVGFIML